MPDLKSFDEKSVPCGKCKFWNENGINTGQCRRMPPQVGPGGHGKKWPITSATDWCGEGALPYHAELTEKYLALFPQKEKP